MYTLHNYAVHSYGQCAICMSCPAKYMQVNCFSTAFMSMQIKSVKMWFLLYNTYFFFMCRGINRLTHTYVRDENVEMRQFDEHR